MRVIWKDGTIVVIFLMDERLFSLCYNLDLVLKIYKICLILLWLYWLSFDLKNLIKWLYMMFWC